MKLHNKDLSMRKIYPFLKDQQARQEIYKHKWIESEKAGREIGFATAAYDWITQYGQSWLDYHKKNPSQLN